MTPMESRATQARMRHYVRLLLSLLVACNSGETSVCTDTGQALNVCASGATIQGVDVYEGQGNVDWTKVKASGIDFAIARVSDG